MKNLINKFKLDDWSDHNDKVVKFLIKEDLTKEASRDSKKYINLSSLLQLDCPRYYYISWDIPDIKQDGAPNASMKNVWVMGKALEQHVVSSLIKHYGRENSFGKWSCMCGDTYHNGLLSKVAICPKCNTLDTEYNEFDICSDKYGIVGHPDYVAMYNGKLLVYEFKSTKIDTYKEIISGNLSKVTKDMMAKHRLQGISYIKLLRDYGYEVHDRLMLAYIAKDYTPLASPYHIEQCVPTEDEYLKLQKMFDSAKETLSFKEKKELPCRICKSMQDGYDRRCKLVDHCFRLSDNLNESLGQN